MQGLRQDSDAKIKSVLTEAQKQQYDAMRQQEHEHARQGH
jgi:hypothetical protein